MALARPRVQLLLLVVATVFAMLSPVRAFDMDTIESDEEGVVELKSAVSAGWVVNTKVGKSLVTTAMARGYWETAEHLIHHSKSVRADVTHAVYKSASSIRKRLKLLEEALNKRQRVSKGIPPAFEWAQSPDTIFLNVKFAHKLDTPATLGCKASNVTIAAKEFKFVAECKTKRKVFELKFTPLKEFDGEASSWTMASVGRAVFTLKKARNQTWSRLMQSQGRKPANMHVWWSMKEQYDEENAEFAKVESRLKRKEFEDKQRAKAEAAKDGGDLEVKVAEKDEAADATAAAAATNQKGPDGAAEEADTAPALSAFDIAKADLEKKYRKLKRTLDEELRANVATIDKEAREQKKEVLARAKAEKQEIAERAAARRKDATEAAASGKEALLEQQARELEELRLVHAEGAAEL